MPSLSERDPRLYVEDMLEFCGRALDYAAGVSRESLDADQMRYDAILRNLELIGEAATHVESEHRALASNVPVARGNCHSQPCGPRLSGHRCRHDLEHPARRLADAAHGAHGIAERDPAESAGGVTQPSSRF